MSPWSPGRFRAWPAAGTWSPMTSAMTAGSAVIAGCMEGYGTRIQYSVFVCDLSDQEKVIMRSDMEALMKASEDSVMVIDLGQAGDSAASCSSVTMRNCPPSSTVIV